MYVLLPHPLFAQYLEDREGTLIISPRVYEETALMLLETISIWSTQETTTTTTTPLFRLVHR